MAVLALGGVAADRALADPLALSLEAALEKARATSAALDSARAAAEVARADALQAAALPNPNLAYAREATSRGGDDIEQDIVLIEQAFEVAGQRGLRRDAAALRRDGAEARARAAELELAFAVTRAFARANRLDHRMQACRIEPRIVPE